MNLNKFRRQAGKDSEMYCRRTKELAQKTIPEALNKKYGEIKVTDPASRMFYLTRLFNFIEHNERMQIGDGMDYQGFWEFAARWVNEQEKNRYKRGILKFCRTYYPIQNKLEIIVRDASKLLGAGVERVQKKDGKTTAEILAGGPLQLSHELFHVFERLYREDLGLEPIQPRTPQSEFFALFGELSYAQKRQKTAGGIEPLKFEFRSNELLYMAAKSILISPQEEIDLAAIYLLQQLNEQKRKEVFMKCHEIPGLNQNPELLLKTITPYLPKKH